MSKLPGFVRRASAWSEPGIEQCFLMKERMGCSPKIVNKVLTRAHTHVVPRTTMNAGKGPRDSLLRSANARGQHRARAGIRFVTEVMPPFVQREIPVRSSAGAR